MLLDHLCKWHLQKLPPPAACTCDCEEGNRVQLRGEDREVDAEDDGWQDCECTFCGPALEDGSRRCKVKVSPVVKLRTAIDSGVWLYDALPSVCGGGWGECARRAGEAGEDDQGQAVARVTP